MTGTPHCWARMESWTENKRWTMQNGTAMMVAARKRGNHAVSGRESTSRRHSHAEALRKV